MSTQANDLKPASATPPMRRIVVPSTLAAALEYFDFFAFTIAAALVFGPYFFPTLGGTGGPLGSFATLFVGFAARPIGGIIFGHLGDRWGRKPVLVLSSTLMGAFTTVIGILPGYAAIGVAAPILLVVARIGQGLALGGLWGGAALLSIEHCDRSRRGIYGSMQGFGNGLGALVANLVFLVLALQLSRDDLLEWGWRIPFLMGVPMMLIGWYIHRSVEESPVFRKLEDKRPVYGAPRAGMGLALRKEKLNILLAGGAFVLANGVYYIFISGMLDYGTRILGLPSSAILIPTLIAIASQLITIPLFGWLSDRYGRKLFFIVGAIGMAAWAYPVFVLVGTRSAPLIVLALIVGLTLHSMLYAPQSALFAEMFPARSRFSGATLGYQLGTVFGGGLAPFIMTGLLAITGTTVSVAGYIILLAVVTGGSVLAIRSTAQRDLDD